MMYTRNTEKMIFVIGEQARPEGLHTYRDCGVIRFRYRKNYVIGAKRKQVQVPVERDVLGDMSTIGGDAITAFV